MFLARIVKDKFFQILLYALVGVLIYAVVLHFSEFEEIFTLFKKANPWLILLAVLVQASTYFFAGRAMQQILRTLGHRFSLWFTAELYLALIFLSNTIPTGSFTNVVYMIRVLRNHGVRHGQGATVSLILLVTGYIGFFFLLLVGMLFLPGAMGLGEIHCQRIIATFAIAILLLILVDRIIAKRERLCRFLDWLSFKTGFDRSINWTADFISEIGKGRDLFMQSKSKFISPIISQFSILFLDCLTIWFIFYAFGSPTRFAVVAVAYAVGRIVGIMSLLPGGVGSFDVAQILMLKTFGVPLAAATIVTLFFRLLAYWIPTPIGAFFFKRINNKQKMI